MMEQNLDELRKHNIALAKQALAEATGGESSLDDLYAKDCKFYQPFFFPGRITPINPSEPEDSELLAHEDTVSIFHGWTYDPDSEQIYTTQDPNCIIILNSGKGLVMREDGKDYPYENSYVHVFHFRDGKIASYYEYANPLRLMDAMGIPHPELPFPEETDQHYKELGLL